jgi:DNA (cytosine-5)-methyltransferase 1
VPIYEDVRELTAERLKADGIVPNVITGGFPCQDISVAGNQKGIGEGTRSGLWSECARLVGEIRPDYAIFENVTALISGESGKWFERVLWDISALGYDAEWHCIPASELGAHHHRDRIWIIAYPKSAGSDRTPNETSSKTRRSNRQKTEQSTVDGEIRSVPKAIPTNTSEQRCNNRSDNWQERHLQDDKEGQYEQSLFAKAYREGKAVNALTSGTPDIWKVEPELGRVANGIPDRSHRLKGLGNAVVPQIPEIIGNAILENRKNHAL